MIFLDLVDVKDVKGHVKGDVKGQSFIDDCLLKIFSDVKDVKGISSCTHAHTHAYPCTRTCTHIPFTSFTSFTLIKNNKEIKELAKSATGSYPSHDLSHPSRGVSAHG